MAIRLRFIAGLSLVLVAAIFAAGCGVKAPPTARSEIKPSEVVDMTAEVQANGVRVSFTVPEGERPSQAIELVKLYYGYLPLGGDPKLPSVSAQAHGVSPVQPEGPDPPDGQIDGGRPFRLSGHRCAHEQAVGLPRGAHRPGRQGQRHFRAGEGVSG